MPNLDERAYLDQCAPTVETTATSSSSSSFEIHSFEEPSPFLYQMQQYYMSSTLASDSLRAVWKWFPLAASDEIQQVQFEAFTGMKGVKSKRQLISLATLRLLLQRQSLWTRSLDILFIIIMTMSIIIMNHKLIIIMTTTIYFYLEIGPLIF
jgi:hypothetical protein